jgi:sec-independent protein translocase protein TatA
MMPTLGAPELIIILVIIILIFGVGKLPEVGQALGKGIREFRGAADGGENDDEAPAAAPARPAAPAAVEAPRPSAAVEAPRQPVTAPVAPAAPVAQTTTSYTVAAGDTPETVATKHGVTVDELLSANGWNQRDRVLYEGDKITVPAKNTAA